MDEVVETVSETTTAYEQLSLMTTVPHRQLACLSRSLLFSLVWGKQLFLPSWISNPSSQHSKRIFFFFYFSICCCFSWGTVTCKNNDEKCVSVKGHQGHFLIQLTCTGYNHMDFSL